ncbi:MAG: PAS domain S-box protein [Chloroherpetonaceae bacterium]
MPLDQALLNALKSCCKDDVAFERARTLFEIQVAKSHEIEAVLQHTIDTLQGEARERLKLEESLAAQEHFYRTMFENINIGLAFKKGNRVERANQAYLNMLGYTIDELLQHTLADFTHPDDLMQQQALNAQLERGEINQYNLVKRYIRKDGTTLWAETSVSAMGNKMGERLILVAVRDVTQEIVAKEQILKSEAQLAWLLNALPFAIAIYKNKAQIFANNAFFNSRGLRDMAHWLEAKKQEPINDDYALIHPDDYTSFVANLDDYRRRVDSGELLKTERRIRRYGETEYRWYECSLFKGDYIDGEKVVVEADVPIESRKQAELAVQEAKLRVQNIIAQSAEFLIAVDANYRLTLFNQKAEASLRQVKPDLELGDNFLDLVYKRKPLWKECIERAFRGEIAFIESSSYSDVHLNATAFYETTFSPIRNSKDEITEVAILTVDVTERKLRELELLKVQNLLSETEQLACIGSWEFDIKTGETFWTKEVYRIYERDFSLPPLRDDAYYAQIHPDDLDLMKSSHLAILNGTPYDITIRILTDTNKVKWVRTVGKPITENGEVVRMIGTTMDVTEMKNRELALRESQDFLQSIYYGTSTPIFVIDVETETRFRVVGLNPAYVQRIDMPAEKVLGKTIQEIGDVLGHDLADAIQANYEACVQSGTEMVYEETFIVNGQTSHYLTRLNPLRDAFGRVYRIVGSSLNITQRKVYEEELRRNEAMLSDTEQLAHIGSWTVNFETDTLSWSDEVFRIYEIEKSLGAPSYEEMFQSSPDAPTIMPIIKEATEKGSGFSISKRIVFAGDRVKWVEVIGTPIQNEQGSLCGYSGYVRDITHEREMQADRDLLYAQLLQSQKMESIGVLASGVAHEFNNILAGILGAATLLKKEVADNPKAEKRVAQIEAASERAATIVKQMLGFARQGKMNVQTIDFRRCINDILDVFTPTLDKRIHVATHFQVDEATACVEGDKGQLEQVILNLAVNARDALMDTLSKKTHAEISFTLTAEPLPKSLVTESGATSDAPMLHLAVKDNGIGMPKEIQAKVFEPFFTTKEVGKGTGLGLSMVYGIVKNHQGFISVESVVGEGTVFHLYFPLSARNTAEFPDTSHSDVVGAAIKGTILVVDDEPLIREFLTELLEEHGYLVYSQSNGKDGLAFFEAHIDEIDLVVIDKNMPEMDGERLLSQLTSLRANLRLMVITGYLEAEDVIALEEKGACKVFTKPFKPQQFLDAVASALQSG